MRIYRHEIYLANKPVLDKFFAQPPVIQTQSPEKAMEQSALARIIVDPPSPKGGVESEYYSILVRLKLLTAAVKQGDQYDFLVGVAKGLFRIAGDVASGAFNDVVVDGVNCGTSTAQKIKDILTPDHKSFNTPFVVPVHAHRDKKYTMRATIKGSSIVTDTRDRDAFAILIPGQGKESDETAKITATIKLCSEEAFNRGGVVDRSSARTSGLESNKGIEYNIEGLERTYTIYGTTQCDCLPAERVITSWAEPEIYVETDGALGGAASAISVETIFLEYIEEPCEHRTRIPQQPVPETPRQPGPPEPPRQPPKESEPMA